MAPTSNQDLACIITKNQMILLIILTTGFPSWKSLLKGSLTPSLKDKSSMTVMERRRRKIFVGAASMSLEHL